MFETSRSVALALTLLLTGCSEDQDAGSLGKSVGENVTEFAQGVGTGVDVGLKVNFELSEALKEAGVTATVAKQETPLNSPNKTITIYIIADKAMDATLVAKAYNADEQEIGRAHTDVVFVADDARYIGFEFPAEMDRQMVKIYRIDLRRKVATEASFSTAEKPVESANSD